VVDCSTLPPATRRNCEIDQANQQSPTAPATDAPAAPAPAAIRTIVVENQCTNNIAVGNLFKTSDPAAIYDVRCADYVTLATGESVYLEIPPGELEAGYLSVWDTVNQKTPFNASKLNGLSTGAHLGEIVDSTKEHIECDNQLNGNDIWYSYTIENDVVTVSC
jgi:hypothetical protein